MTPFSLYMHVSAIINILYQSGTFVITDESTLTLVGSFCITNSVTSLVTQAVKNLPAVQKMRKIPRRREWKPTPILLPGKSHGQRSLVDYSPKGCKELDMAYICNWMDKSRKVSFARQELWSASLIIWFFLLVSPTFFLWSTWDRRFTDSSVD